MLRRLAVIAASALLFGCSALTPPPGTLSTLDNTIRPGTRQLLGQCGKHQAFVVHVTSLTGTAEFLCDGRPFTPPKRVSAPTSGNPLVIRRPCTLSVRSDDGVGKVVIFVMRRGWATAAPPARVPPDRRYTVSVPDGSCMVEETTETYPVRGQTAEELRRALDQSRPTGPDGRRFDGITRRKVRVEYAIQPTTRGYQLASVVVSARVRTTLPQWVNREDGPAELVATWDIFHRNLVHHERGHRDIAVAAAKEVARNLLPLKSRLHEDCDALRALLKSARQRALEIYRKKERAFDATTRHGWTQGAVFPPS
ncbi:DUF922 domain-containing protein [Planctomycetota bacterium]